MTVEPNIASFIKALEFKVELLEATIKKYEANGVLDFLVQDKKMRLAVTTEILEEAKKILL